MLNLNLDKLEDLILNEADLASLLGVDTKRLAYLRTAKGLPCVYVSNRVRIYLGIKVYEWLEKLSQV